MSTITSIENTILSAITGLSLFKQLEAAGRKANPPALNYPACFIYLFSARRAEVNSRPVYDMVYELLVVVKNLSGEAVAGQDAYALLEAIIGAIDGKQLGLTDVENFKVAGIELDDYQDGIIRYAIQIAVKHYRPVPVE